MLINDASITGSLIVNASASFQNINVAGNIIPNTTNIHNLGSPDKYFKEIYVSTGSINFVDETGVVGTLNAGTINALQTTTESANSRLDSIESVSASLQTFTASVSQTNTFTSSATSRLNSIEAISASNISRLNSIEIISASNLNRLSALETTSASVDTLNTNQNNRLNSLEDKTGSLAITGSNTFFGTQVFSGSVYVKENLIVQGSSSLQNITASAVDIGTNRIILNANTPSVRYAGISVYDSGSNLGTGSLWWDSVDNHWLYEHPADSGAPYNSAILISGPKNAGNLGEELELVNNYIVKAVGGDHISSSAIYDDGTTISLKSNTEISGTLSTTGIITGKTYFISSPNTTISGEGPYDWVYLGASDSNALRATAVQIGDISGAKYAITLGNYGLSLSKHVSGSNSWAKAISIIASGVNDASPKIYLSGSVGIGVSSPLYKLDILGTSGTTSSMRISASYDGGGIGLVHLTSNGNEGGSITFEKTSGTPQKYKIGASNGNQFFVYNETNATQPFTITNTGMVGINTIPASSFVEIYTTSSYGGGNGTLKLHSNTVGQTVLNITNTSVPRSYELAVGGTTNTTPGAFYIYDNTGGGQRFTLTSAGSIGINTVTPAKKLDIYDSNGNATAQLKLRNAGTTQAAYLGAFSGHTYLSAGGSYDSGWSIDGSNGISNIVLETGNGGSAIAFGTAASNTTATERVRIYGAGYVTKPYQTFFQAYSGGGSWTTNQTIVWSQTLNNIGSGYSTSTGRFTAPITGVYLFRADFRAPNTSVTNIMDIKTSTGLMTRHEEPAGQNPYHTTISAIYKLNAGDYVYCEAGAGTIQPDANSIDRFEGYLLG